MITQGPCRINIPATHNNLKNMNMKTPTQKPRAKFILWIAIGFSLISVTSEAISIFVSPLTYNTIQTDTNKIQFDVYVKNTGSDVLGYKLHTLRFTMNRAILPAGAMTGGSVVYQANTGDVRLAPIQSTYNAASSFSISSSTAQINMGSSGAAFNESNAPLVNPNDSIWLGTFIVTSPVRWICNTSTTPAWVQGTPCSIFVYDAPPSTNLTAICNSVNSGVNTVSTGNLQSGVVNSVNPSGLGRAPASILLTCTPTDVEDVSKTNSVASVFPNPTSGKMNVVFTAKKREGCTLRVVDLLGNMVINEIFTAEEGSNLRKMDLTAISKGMYFLSIEGAGIQVQTKRIVVE